MSVDDIAMRASKFTRGGGGVYRLERENCDSSPETVSRIAGATFAIIISISTNRADYGIAVEHGRLCFCFPAELLGWWTECFFSPAWPE